MHFKLYAWIIVQLFLFVLKLPLIGLFRIWRPSWAFDPGLMRVADQVPGEVNVEHYAMSGDGGKFLGLLYAALPTEENWEGLKRLWRTDSFIRATFTRYARPEMDALADNFSGDQLSGMLYALVQREMRVGLTDEEKASLRLIWLNTLCISPILTFKHPTNTKRPDRGYLLGWMSFGCDLIQTLAFLEFGHVVLGIPLCGRLFRAYAFWLRPLLLCVDTAFALGRVYAAAWYDEHSTMLACCCGRDDLFQAPMKFLRDRYPANPDIQGLFYRHDESSDSVLSGAHDSRRRAEMFLDDYTLDGRAVPSDWMVSYFSLRSFSFKSLSLYILPSRYRSGRYLWESNDVQPDQTPKAGLTLDYWFLKSLVD